MKSHGFKGGDAVISADFPSGLVLVVWQQMQRLQRYVDGSLKDGNLLDGAMGKLCGN